MDESGAAQSKTWSRCTHPGVIQHNAKTMGTEIQKAKRRLPLRCVTWPLRSFFELQEVDRITTECAHGRVYLDQVAETKNEIKAKCTGVQLSNCFAARLCRLVECAGGH